VVTLVFAGLVTAVVFCLGIYTPSRIDEAAFNDLVQANIKAANATLNSTVAVRAACRGTGTQLGIAPASSVFEPFFLGTQERSSRTREHKHPQVGRVSSQLCAESVAPPLHPCLTLLLPCLIAHPLPQAFPASAAEAEALFNTTGKISASGVWPEASAVIAATQSVKWFAGNQTKA
jgi:hypothetical protein